MKIQVRQTGGITNLDHRIDFDQSHVRVTRGGSEIRARKLRPPEAAKLRTAAERLLATTGDAGSPAPLVSDSMLTEVSVEDAGRRRVYRVRSGDSAPAELWDLVDALSEAARPG